MRINLLMPSHVPQYRALMLQAYEHAADAFTSTAAERAAEPDSWWIQRIADPQGMSVALGAFEGRELVGTVALEFSSKPKTKHKALLIGMYVVPSLRGTGVGKALLEYALDYTKTRVGTHVMTLTVTQGNEPAFGLYERAGFKVFGTEPMAILTPNGYKAKVHMWRSIASDFTASIA